MNRMALLLSLVLLPSLAFGQAPYGNNPDAGNYFDVSGTKLYYEIYGEGEPLLMLHGGVYGYIDEFEYLIPKLAENHRVICLATRGHGKSEIGHEPYTYAQRAEDAYKLLQHLKIEQTIVLGFSDGGFAALKLAATHPETVTKTIAMGVGYVPEGSRKDKFNYNSEDLLSQNGDFFKNRLKLMPEPERWDESLKMLNSLYNNDNLSSEMLAKIECPVLVMNGEKDQYFSLSQTLACYESIPNASLAVIPQCGHVIFYCNFPAVWASTEAFLK